MAVLTDTLPQVAIDGFDLDGYAVMEVLLHKELLKPAELHVKIRKKRLLRDEGDIAFEMAADLLGANVTLAIDTRRHDEHMEAAGETLSFSGIVFGCQTQRDRIGQAAYIGITAYSPDYLLVDNPHCCSFEKKSLADIIAECVEPYNGTINCELVPSLEDALPYVVQYNETTYQFISRLAQRYGEFFYYENGMMHFGGLPCGPAKGLYPDTDVLGFQYQLDMEHTNFRHAQHDYLRYENTVENGQRDAGDEVHSLADITYDQSNSAYRKETTQNYHSATAEKHPFSPVKKSVRAQAWCEKGHMMTCTMLTNRADLLLGDRLVMQECIDEDGSVMDHEELVVVGIDYHATIDGHFENTVTAIAADVPFAPYGNTDLYPACESQRARVVDNRDPERLGRVRVQFLWQETLSGRRYTPWLRIAQPHGGDDKGFYFIPEIGEEVMVAFENGNAEKPYVVGTLYHGRQHPGRQWPDGSNNVKAIRTRNGHTVEIHDQGAGGYIRIYDYKKENYILTYSTDERLIKLESTGNIELYAANDIIMHAGHDITASAGHDIREEAGNDIFLEAGNDQHRTADNDIIETAGSNRTANISINDTLNVGMNQFIDIGANKDEQIANQLQITAGNIREEAKGQLLEYSNVHQQKADSNMTMNAGSRIDIKAGVVKVQ